MSEVTLYIQKEIIDILEKIQKQLGEINSSLSTLTTAYCKEHYRSDLDAKTLLGLMGLPVKEKEE